MAANRAVESRRLGSLVKSLPSLPVRGGGVGWRRQAAESFGRRPPAPIRLPGDTLLVVKFQDLREVRAPSRGT